MEPSIQQMLAHIHSLRIISEKEMRLADLQTLHNLGYIRKVWIGNYALTEAGQRARRDRPVKSAG